MKFITSVVVGFFLLSSGPAGPPADDYGEPVPDAAISELVRSAAATAGIGCGAHCDECGIFNWYNEVFSCPIGWDCDWHDFPFSCTDAPCPNPCVPEEDEEDLLEDGEVVAVWNAVAANDMNALHEYVTSRTRVFVNAARGAVQIVGCNDAVVAHIPLTSTQFSFLSQ